MLIFMIVLLQLKENHIYRTIITAMTTLKLIPVKETAIMKKITTVTSMLIWQCKEILVLLKIMIRNFKRLHFNRIEL